MALHPPLPPVSFIPSPPVNGFHLGPAFVHFYGLMYVVGIALAIVITRRRARAAGADPSLVTDLATWSVPAGIIGGRVYFDITTPADIPHHWWGVFAVWSGGLGIWGGIAAGALVGAWRVRRSGASVPLFMDAVAPALLVAQAVGRIGNYFNQELFGKPSGLPWALQIAVAHRPAGFRHPGTFQPTFLYEMIFDLALAAALVWLGHHRGIRPPGLFALYVTGYSVFRIFEETLRIDSSVHFLGLRLNFYVAIAATLIGLGWFVITQRRAPRGDPAGGPGGAAGTQNATAGPEDATAGPQGATAGPQGATAGPQGATAGPQGATAGPQGATAGPQGTAAGPHDGAAGGQDAAGIDGSPGDGSATVPSGASGQ
jgi:prolipoprotein diacylglyceryl transferase